MSWEAAIAISEIIGAIAIVVTLVYLSIQLRQNTQAIKSSTWQATQDAEQRFDESIHRDPAIADLYSRGMKNGLKSLEGAERRQYWLIHKQLLDLFQTHHYHYERGTIDEDFWRCWLAQLEDALSESPSFGEDILPRLGFLRPSFRRVVEESLTRCNITTSVSPAEES